MMFVLKRTRNECGPLIENYARNIYDYAAITTKNGQKCNLDNCRLFSSLRHVLVCLFVILRNDYSNCLIL